MAMTMKARLALVGIGVLLVAVTLLYFAMQRLAIHYKETNATWRIQGLCTNPQNGTPVKAAQITASFTEPISFKHHWRSPPPLGTTNVVTKSDDQGRFEITGEGG